MNPLQMLRQISVMKAYRFSVVFAILLIVSNLGLMLFVAFQKQGEAKVINIAGQQRMLSQKVTRHFFELHLTMPEEKAIVTKKLNQELKQWSAGFQLLKEGSIALAVPKCEDDICDSLAIIEQQLFKITDVIINQQLFRVTPQQIVLTSQEIDIFLAKMGNIINILEARADKRLNHIYYLQLFLVFNFLMVIVLEYIFVFRKMFAKNRRQYRTILEENRKLKEIAQIQSHKVRKPVASILGLIALIDKNQCHEEQAEFLDALEIATNELDEVIHEIVDKTKGNIHTQDEDYQAIS